MTYVPRRRFTRRPKDILTLALKNLWAGEELICTQRTYDAIRDRVNDFARSKQDRRIATIRALPLVKLRRVE